MKYHNINNNNNNGVGSGGDNQWPSPSPLARGAPPTPPATPPLPASPLPAVRDLPRPEQWLGKVAAVTLAGNSPTPPRRAPLLSHHLRAHSLGSAETYYSHHNANGTSDPFDAEWAAIASRNGQQRGRSTNPFLSGNSATPVKAFEVQM